MASLNKCIFIGYVAKDPESKMISSSKVCNFSIGVSENWKDKQGNKKSKTEWVNIVCWGNQAEFVEKYIKKGNLLYIEGKQETQSWDSDDGKKYKTVINAFSVQSLSSINDQQVKGDPLSDLPF